MKFTFYNSGIVTAFSRGRPAPFVTSYMVGREDKERTTEKCLKKQPWTIILLVYVGSIVDLIGLTDTNDKRSRDRCNVELITFKGVLYFGRPNQPSLGTMRIYIENLLQV